MNQGADVEDVGWIYASEVIVVRRHLSNCLLPQRPNVQKCPKVSTDTEAVQGLLFPGLGMLQCKSSWGRQSRAG